MIRKLTVWVAGLALLFAFWQVIEYVREDTIRSSSIVLVGLVLGAMIVLNFAMRISIERGEQGDSQ